MDKKTILFIALCFLIILAYSNLNAPKKQLESNQAAPPEPVAQQADTPAPAKMADGSIAAAFEQGIQPSTDKLYIDTKKQSLIIDRAHACLLSCKLKDYYMTAEKDTQVELVGDRAAEIGIFPLQVVFLDPAWQTEHTATAYRAELAENQGLLAIEQTYTLSFTKEIQGRSLNKRLIFHPDSFFMDIEVDITGPKEEPAPDFMIVAGPGALNKDPENVRKGRYSHPDEIMLGYEKVKGKARKKMERDVYVLRDIPSFIALNDVYFAQAFIPGNPPAALLYTQTLYMGFLYGGDKTHVRYYLGPKEKAELKQADPALAGLLSYGIFSIIARPLHIVIAFFGRVFINYGIAIIVLTILIRLIFFPLTFRSYLQMRKMAKLGPQMKDLRKRFKDQPQKMNQEIQLMYKKHGVNPLAGCLPMLIQLPVLIALYRVLSIAIELRNQPFLWIQDLAGPDPYLILPISMSLAMFVQQKLTPTSADQKQAKIMAIMMPLFFFFMFRNLQAGLVLYWFTSNLLVIMEQSIVSKAHGKEQNRMKEKKQ